MNITETADALGVQFKAVRESRQAILETATVEDEAARVAGHVPSAQERFQAVSARIISFAENREEGVLPPKNSFIEHYERHIPIGATGLVIGFVAHISFDSCENPDVGRPDLISAKWGLQGYGHNEGAVMMAHEVHAPEVSRPDVAPEVYGRLRLIEQSLDTVLRAQQIATP